MFIKLEKTDGRPIWLNAAFIVTVEPRKDGGSTVVPVGDGLDYDVKEAPEAVLAMLEGAPVPAIVPIPSSDALKTSAKGADADAAPAEADPGAKPKSAAHSKTTARKTASPRKRTVRKTSPGGDRQPAAEKPEPAQDKSGDNETAGLGEAEIERLRRLSPRSVKKLRNTLTAQFKAKDADLVVRSLEERGVLSVERDHVTWK